MISRFTTSFKTFDRLANVNAQGELYSIALQAASKGSHKEVVVPTTGAHSRILVLLILAAAYFARCINIGLSILSL